MLQLGVALIHLPGDTPEEKLQRAARMGFASVELPALDWNNGYVFNPQIPGRVQAYGAKIRELGLSVSALQCHDGIISSDRAREERNLAFARSAIGMAKAVQAPLVHFISDRMERRNLTDGDRRRLVSRLQDLMEVGYRHNTVVALEPCVNTMVYSHDTALELFDEIPEMRANFDPSHFACIGEDPVLSFAALEDRIVHCHAKDGRADGSGFRFTPLGQGAVDWQALIDGLRAANYSGVLSIEYEGHLFGYETNTAEGILADRRFLLSLDDRRR